MKKTLLLALLGASSLAVAKGSVSLSNEASSLLHEAGQQESSFKKKLTSNHKLLFSISENNFTVSGELKRSGKYHSSFADTKKLVKLVKETQVGVEEKLEYKLGDFGGHIKLAYDDSVVATSLKYELDNKATLNGSYTYKKDSLTVKPEVELKGFKDASLKISNYTGYVVDDKLTLKNNIAVNINFIADKYPTWVLINGIAEYKVADELKLENKLEVTKSLNGKKGSFKLPTKLLIGMDDEYKSDQMNEFSLKNTATAKLKVGESLELDGKFELGILSDVIEASKNTYKNINPTLTGGVVYKPVEVKGLKVDGSLTYGYDISESVTPFDEESPVKMKTTGHIFKLKGGLSYEVDIVKGVKTTPSLKASYEAQSRNFNNGEKEKVRSSKNLLITPELNLSYNMDKMNAKFSIETPFKFNKYMGKFGYDKANIKLNLTLGYDW